MIETFLAWYMPNIWGELQPKESLGDFRTLCEIIAVNHQIFSMSPELRALDVRIALGILCAIPYPGKPPSYIEFMRKLRLDFKGIEKDKRLRGQFMSLLTTEVLSVRNYQELNFHDINTLFNLEYKKKTIVKSLTEMAADIVRAQVSQMVIPPSKTDAQVKSIFALLKKITEIEKTTKHLKTLKYYLPQEIVQARKIKAKKAPKLVTKKKVKRAKKKT